MTLEVCASSPAGDAAPALAGPPSEPPRFDLRGLLARVQSAVRSGVPRQAWVACSVVKVHRRKSGYLLELGENDADRSPMGGRLEAFLFEKDLASVREQMGMPDFDPADLENASAVLLLSLSFHARFHLQAVVQDINPALGHSVLSKHISRIRERLRAEGLLERQARLPKPCDIQRLAVVHPVGAAGWADVSRELKRLEDAGVLALVDVAATFEGSAATPSLRAALRKVRDSHGVDAVMFIRGGGATSGLLALANEDLARDICECPIPVITGIGHASDRTLVDELAWHAADTPSKALRFVLELISRPAQKARGEFAELVRVSDHSITACNGDLHERLKQAASLCRGRHMSSSAQITTAFSGLQIEISRSRSALDHQADWLEALRSELVARTPLLLQSQGEGVETSVRGGATTALFRLDQARSELRGAVELGVAVRALLDTQSNSIFQLRETFFAQAARLRDANVGSLADLERSLRALSVDDTLGRGFVLVTSPDSRTLVTSTEQARTMKNLVLHFVDGTVAARLETMH
jgi:exodeoxyribonuclease VII large subunit